MTGSQAPQYHGGDAPLDGVPSAVVDNVVHTRYSTGYAKPVLEKSQTSHRDEMAASDDLIDAKIGKSAAETDTKIARLEGKLDVISANIVSKIETLSGQVAEQRRDRNLIIGTIVVAAVAVGGLVVSMATYGDALFGRGMNVHDLIQTTVKETLQQPPK